MASLVCSGKFGAAADKTKIGHAKMVQFWNTEMTHAVDYNFTAAFNSAVVLVVLLISSLILGSERV